jgi:hypothetical protein
MHESFKGLNVEGQSPRWWVCIAVAFPGARLWMRLRERERQITYTVAIVAVAAIAVVVIVVDGIGLLPGQGW